MRTGEWKELCFLIVLETERFAEEQNESVENKLNPQNKNELRKEGKRVFVTWGKKGNGRRKKTQTWI